MRMQTGMGTSTGPLTGASSPLWGSKSQRVSQFLAITAWSSVTPSAIGWSSWSGSESRFLDWDSLIARLQEAALEPLENSASGSTGAIISAVGRGVLVSFIMADINLVEDDA